MKHKHNIVYKTTNLINGKYYYGIHSTDNLEDGYLGSGIQLKNAIKKYGIENFRREIIKDYKNRSLAVKCEKKIVTIDLVRNKKCYNLHVGGESRKLRDPNTIKKLTESLKLLYADPRNHPFYGKKHTEETKKKIGIKSSERKHSHKTRKLISEKTKGANNPNHGKHLSDAQKKHLSNKLTGLLLGNKHPLYGKPRSTKTKKLISDKLIGKYIGNKNPFYGKHHTVENKEKAKNRMLGKFVGDKNPNYGKKHTIETKIRIGQLSKNKKHSEETRKKMSESHKKFQNTIEGKKWIEDCRQRTIIRNTGKKLSEETKKKISLSNKGKSSPSRRPVIVNDVFYDSIKKACIANNTTKWEADKKLKNFKTSGWVYA